jgi:hypothetical protein
MCTIHQRIRPSETRGVYMGFSKEAHRLAQLVSCLEPFSGLAVSRLLRDTSYMPEPIGLMTA